MNAVRWTILKASGYCHPPAPAPCWAGAERWQSDEEEKALVEEFGESHDKKY